MAEPKRISDQTQMYFFNTIQNYTVSFIYLFTDIHFELKKGGKTHFVRVPVIHGDFNKYGAAREYVEKYGENKLAGYNNTPIISIKLTDIQPNKDKKIINDFNYEMINSNELKTLVKSRVPRPFTYKFSVTVFARYQYHMNQIIEQIWPYFYDTYSIRVREFPEISDITRNVVIRSTGNSYIDYPDLLKPEDSGSDTLQTTFDFELDGMMYFPLKTNVGRINEIIVNYEDKDSGEEYGQQYAKEIGNYIDILEKIKLQKELDNGATIQTNEMNVDVISNFLTPEEE